MQHAAKVVRWQNAGVPDSGDLKSSTSRQMNYSAFFPKEITHNEHLPTCVNLLVLVSRARGPYPRSFAIRVLWRATLFLFSLR